LLVYYEIQKIIVPLYRVRERSKTKNDNLKNHDYENSKRSIRKDDQSRCYPLGPDGGNGYYLQPNLLTAMKTNIDLLHDTYIGSQRSNEEKAALIVGKVFNIILAIAGATTCIYGVITWIQHHNF